MDLPLNDKSQQLLDALMTIPPDLATAEKLLQQECFSSDEVTKVAMRYADECFLDIADKFRTDPDDRISFSGFMPPPGVVPGLHSTYLYDVVKLLLDYGLDPNAIIDEDNIMEMLLYVDNEYVAADTIALLLEHGGDPNQIIDGESVFQQIDFGIWFDAVELYIRWRYDAWVHIWMVLLAYGCKDSGIKVFREYNSDTLFDLKKLRYHRNYYFGLSYEDQERVIHIYDKNTFWEVARG
jgi:hypothetical protein